MAAIVAVSGASAATAQTPVPPTPVPNPCVDPLQMEELRCPDLQMAPPRDMFVTERGKVLLHATNDIRSRGEGPLEIRGTRTSKRYMSVRQAIHTAGGGRQLFDTAGELIFYFIPGQGNYWKFEDAAKFELFQIDPATGARGGLVRTGPKLNYCFRDLRRTGSGGPKKRVYPGCSQDPKLKARTLGTSVGWSDIYPASYYENWINIKGLSGCYEFVMTADPLNRLFENDEANNQGSVRVQLPTSGRRVNRC